MIEKKKLKTTGQAIDYLNEAVLGKDPDYPAVAREYEGVEPLQDRIGGIEQVDRDITNRLDVIENLDRDISDQLANKADKSQVAQDLAFKADTSVVEGKLALKADKTELTPKADITYVDSELANKLDASNAESIIGVTTQADVVNGNSTPKLVSGKVIKDYTATKVDAVQLQDGLSGKADKTTKVNNKPLSSDIELTSADIIDTYTAKPVSQAIEDLSFELYDYFIRLTGYVLATNDDFIVKDASNSYFEYIGTDEYIVVPKTVQGYQVTNLRSGSDAGMFNNVSNVKGVVTANKLSDFNRAFYYCKSTSLDLRYLYTSQATDMQRMFRYCSNLTSLNVSSFDTSNVTNMGSMFFTCSNLTTLDLSSFDTSNVTNMLGMFQSCNNLTTLDLSNFTHESIGYKENMFLNVRNCTVYFKDQDEIDFFTADTGWDASNTAVIKGA